MCYTLVIYLYNRAFYAKRNISHSIKHANFIFLKIISVKFCTCNTINICNDFFYFFIFFIDALSTSHMLMDVLIRTWNFIYMNNIVQDTSWICPNYTREGNLKVLYDLINHWTNDFFEPWKNLFIHFIVLLLCVRIPSRRKA